MEPPADVAEFCRRAQRVCQTYHPSITCEVFDSEFLGKYAALRNVDPPSEGQLGLIVTATPAIVDQVDLRRLVGELEEMSEVWRVFLTFPKAYGRS